MAKEHINISYRLSIKGFWLQSLDDCPPKPFDWQPIWICLCTFSPWVSMAKLQRIVAKDEFSSSVKPTRIWFDGECQEAMWNYQHVLKSSHRVITSRTPSKNAPQWPNVTMFLFGMQNEGVVSFLGKINTIWFNTTLPPPPFMPYKLVNYCTKIVHFQTECE